MRKYSLMAVPDLEPPFTYPHLIVARRFTRRGIERAYAEYSERYPAYHFCPIER